MMKFPILPVLLLMTLLALSCKKEVQSPPIPGGTSFEAVIANGGEFESFSPKSDSTLLDSTIVEENGIRWACVTKEYDFVSGGDEYFNFNPSSEIIWPGNLIQGNSITEATPNPIVVERGAGCVTIDLVNGSSGTQKCMDKVSNGNIIQSLNEIIDQNNGVLPAQFSYTSEEIQSQEQMAFKMGVNYNTLTTSVKGKLSVNTSQEYTSFLVTLTQNFYTMIFEKPTSYDEFFGTGVTPDDLAPYIGPNNPGTYISSVTYGRRFYLLVESTESRSEIKASIKASYDAAVTNGSISAGGKYVKDLENSTIKVFALGGDQGLALSTFNGDMTAVGNYLTSGGDYRTGVPLSYVIRSLETHQDLAVKVATKYETTVCTPLIYDENPPIFTAFWGDAFDAIGAAAQMRDGKIILFNKAGTDYVVCDEVNYSFEGPFSLDDPNAPLQDCPLDAVSAAELLPSGNLYLHDGTGTKYVAFKANNTYTTVNSLSMWGNDNHPFDLYGVGAGIEDNQSSKVIHFSRDGTRYAFYYSSTGSFSNVFDLWQWGPDNTCPIDAVGAGVKLELANNYFILFDLSGTEYTIYRSTGSGEFIGLFKL